MASFRMLTRKYSFTILAAFALLWIGSYGFAQDAPPMPKGFESEEALKAALLMGQIKIIDAAHVTVPDTVEEIKDIEYGKVGDRSLQLDLYVPKNLTKPVPVIVFIHGGAWKSGKRSDMKFYTVDYAAKGYVTATISYRFTQEAIFPAAVQDAKCAIRWLRANAKKYHIDPDKIGVSGNSAGGHLSMMIGYSSDAPELEGNGGNPGVSSRVQAVVDFYGPVDMTTPFARKQGVLISFLGGKTYEEAPELYVKSSPMTYLTPDDPPTAIFHGTIDSVVPIDQADSLAKKLQELKIPYVYDRFEGWIHTMDLAEAVNVRCRYQMDKFFAKYLPVK
ncbi:MAG: alpha/beta hydrolase [Candidatus Omnitrophota bacterium]